MAFVECSEMAFVEGRHRRGDTPAGSGPQKGNRAVAPLEGDNPLVRS